MTAHVIDAEDAPSSPLKRIDLNGVDFPSLDRTAIIAALEYDSLNDDHKRTLVFTPVLRLKDGQCRLQLAQNLGIGSSSGSLASDKFRHVCDLGFWHNNESNLIEVARISVMNEPIKTLSPREYRAHQCDSDIQLHGPAHHAEKPCGQACPE